MTYPPPVHREQLLLRHARVEGTVIMLAWVITIAWSIGGGYVLGYLRDPATMGLVFGMPDWVFWCVALPWVTCVLFSIWFCFCFMADDDLGHDPTEEPGHA